MTIANLNRGICGGLLGSAYVLLLLGPPAACDRSGDNKAPPKQTPPSAATTPTPATPPTPPAPPPPAPRRSPRAGRRDGAARRRGEDRERPRLEGAAARAPARSTRPPHDIVKVHYTGWTTDGKMFDSSVTRGQPAHVPARRRHQGLDRGRAADGRRREAPLLDPGRTSPTASTPAAAARRACSCSTSSCSTSPGPDADPAPEDVAAPPKSAKKTKSRPRLPGAQEGHRQGAPQGRQHGRGALHGLDDRRQDVRQLGHARRAGHVPAQRRHPGLDRGRAADGRRREDPLLDPRQPRLRQLARGPARPRACWCSTSSCCRSSSKADSLRV